MTQISEHSPIDVAWIASDRSQVVLNDGQRLPVVECFDDEGEECEAPEAVVLLAGSDGLGWWKIWANYCDNQSIH